MQEIAIPDATFLDGDANTYPGEYRKNSLKRHLFDLFCQLFSVALIAIPATWQIKLRLLPV